MQLRKFTYQLVSFLVRRQLFSEAFQADRSLAVPFQLVRNTIPFVVEALLQVVGFTFLVVHLTVPRILAGVAPALQLRDPS